MKKALCLVISLILLVGLTACGGGAESNSSNGGSTGSGSGGSSDGDGGSGGELTKLIYGAPSTATSCNVWYAYQNGYFEEYGVDLELIFFNSGTSLNDAARAGEVDVYSLGGMSSLTGATTFGSKFVAYLDPDNAAYRVYARNDSAVIQSGQGHIAAYPEVYGSAEAWAGSTVLLTKGQSGHYTINAILELLGLEASDISVIDMEQNQIPATFAAGEGDIMVVGNPNWAEFAADPDNYTMVASLDQLYPDYDNVATIMATADAIANKEDAVYGFVKGLTRAEQEMANDDALYKDWMYQWQQEYNVSVTEESAHYDTEFYKLATYDFLEEYMSGEPGESIVENTFQSFADFMLANDQLSQETYDNLDISDIIRTEYTLRAVEELRAGN